MLASDQSTALPKWSLTKSECLQALVELLVTFTGMLSFPAHTQSARFISSNQLNLITPSHPSDHRFSAPSILSFGEATRLWHSSLLVNSPFPLALRSVCDVGAVLCVSAAGSHTCLLAPATTAAQSQSPSLITQFLKNKEIGNVNQPAWQLQQRSTPLCNKHHSN